MTPQPAATLHPAIDAVRQSPLKDVPRPAAAKIVRRIVDNDGLVPRLETAKFNSAI